jgi:glycosyltransferase involved in cell wall biosynthesis
VVIPNPFNLDAIYCHSQAAPDHPWLQQAGEPVILSLGRLARAKNFPLLLKAFATVPQRLDVKLVIFGDPWQLASVIEQYSRERQI